MKYSFGLKKSSITGPQNLTRKDVSENWFCEVPWNNTGLFTIWSTLCRIDIISIYRLYIIVLYPTYAHISFWYPFHLNLHRRKPQHPSKRFRRYYGFRSKVFFRICTHLSKGILCCLYYLFGTTIHLLYITLYSLNVNSESVVQLVEFNPNGFKLGSVAKVDNNVSR